MMNTKLMRAFILAAALLTAAVTGLGSAQPASADANGVAGWGGLDITAYGVPIHVPQGALDHTVYGPGQQIDRQWATFASGGQICNWRIDFLRYDDHGNLIRVWGDVNHNECTLRGERQLFAPGGPEGGPPGLACATLLVSDQEIVRQCHNITA